MYREYIELKKQPPQKVVKRYIKLDTLANKRLRTLIRLCHPDRHIGKMQNNATEITSWLLAIQTHGKK